MTTTAITAPGLSGTMRMTWVNDDLTHVMEHANIDEPSGTWTGLACRDHRLALGGDVDTATLQHRLAANSKLADLIWEAPKELAAEHTHASTQRCRLTMQGTPSRQNSTGSRSRKSGRGPGRRTTPRSSYCSTRVSRRSPRSNRSAGSSLPSSTTAALTASRARTSTTSCLPA